MAEATPKVVAPAEAPLTDMFPLTPAVVPIILSSTTIPPPTVPTPVLHKAKSTSVSPLALAEATAMTTVMEKGQTPALHEAKSTALAASAEATATTTGWKMLLPAKTVLLLSRLTHLHQMQW
jgi:hypothetical protein